VPALTAHGGVCVEERLPHLAHDGREGRPQHVPRPALDGDAQEAGPLPAEVGCNSCVGSCARSRSWFGVPGRRGETGSRARCGEVRLVRVRMRRGFRATEFRFRVLIQVEGGWSRGSDEESRT